MSLVEVVLVEEVCPLKLNEANVFLAFWLAKEAKRDISRLLDEVFFFCPCQKTDIYVSSKREFYRKWFTNLI
jgi:hypothetical protein